MDDGRIVDLFLARDEQALAEARAKYGGRLFSLARNLLGDPETALECVSDALFEAWNRIPPHEPREYLFAFLAKLTRASALTRVRARSAAKRSAELVELTGELEALIPSPSDTESEAEARRLRSAIKARALRAQVLVLRIDRSDRRRPRREPKPGQIRALPDPQTA